MPVAADVRMHNQRLVEYIEEMKHQACARNPKTRFKYTCEKACRSLTAADVAIKSARDAKKLEGIGDFLAFKIEDYLERHELIKEHFEVAAPLFSHSQDSHNSEPGRGGNRRRGRQRTATRSTQHAHSHLCQWRQARALSGLHVSQSDSQVSELSWPPSLPVSEPTTSESIFSTASLSQPMSATTMIATQFKDAVNYRPQPLRQTSPAQSQTSFGDPPRGGTSTTPRRKDKEVLVIDGTPTPLHGSCLVISSDEKNQRATSPLATLSNNNRQLRKRKLVETHNTQTAAFSAARPPPFSYSQDTFKHNQPRISQDTMEPSQASSNSRSSDLLDFFATKEKEEYHVTLLIDHREHECNPRLFSLLLQHGIRAETRVLSLCDFLWIIRKSDTAVIESADPDRSRRRARQDRAHDLNEIVLRYCIERKTTSDLAASIIDGRYNEQKNRMQTVGSAIDRGLYLVEGPIRNQGAISTTAIKTALATTMIHNGLSILTTDNLDQSILLLKRLHQQISKAFDRFLAVARLPLGHPARQAWTYTLSCPMPSQIITFKQHDTRCRKGQSLNVRGVFGRQLRQVGGFSAAKAEAVLALHSTPMSLYMVLRDLSEEEAIALLQSISVPGQVRPLGKASATLLCHLYKDMKG